MLGMHLTELNKDFIRYQVSAVLCSHYLSSSPGPTAYRWRDYGALTVIMVGIAVGFHQLYKVSHILVPLPS